MKIELLKDKDFFLLMLGKLVSLIGSQMQSFALSLYVLKITGSATKFASVLAIALIPQLILGPIAGVIADWFDRKKIIVLLDMLNGIMIGIFAIIYKINGGLSLSHIYILVILMSIVSTLFNPAINTVIPTLVKKEELVDANGINSFIMNLGNFIAPLLAGLLLGFFDMFIILIVNSISFILSSISEMFINIPKVNKKPEKINIKSFSKDFMDGVSFIKNKKIIFNIIILSLIINFAFNPIFSIGLPYLSKEILKINDYQYGALQSIIVVAMIIAPFLCSIVSKKFKLSKILFLNIFITSILMGIMAIISSSLYLDLFNSNFIPYITLSIDMFIIGLVIVIVNIATGTMINQIVPLSMMGRVGAVINTGAMAAIPLGQMIFGFLFDKMESWICITIAASILFVSILGFKKALYRAEENDAIESLEEGTKNKDKKIINAIEMENNINLDNIELANTLESE